MSEALLSRDDAVVGRLAGYCAPGTHPSFVDDRIEWTNDEALLYVSGWDGYVIQDVRRLSDLTLILFAGRPILIVLDEPRDFSHLRLLLGERAILLTPADGIHVTAKWPHDTAPILPGIPDVVVNPAEWMAAGGRARRVPPTLAPFQRLRKARLTEFARRVGQLPLPRVQHFWRPVGDVGAFAGLVLAHGPMIRVGAGGPFHTMTPTLLLVDPAELDRLSALTLSQSTIVAAPFALPRGRPIDHLLADFADARHEPFHLHEVAVLGDVGEVTVGCLYGEYVV
ncbi:hypothetical protein [Acuticoccus mangrovi]|uniref:Uncharacterized protein n=1 Tax=Acuticoccus mangrovi TaxID=2796142 RepID=A0A934ILZ8_9HYPH|nr:hypothetical protein [Acuticoccus mangrovi]MBJ3774697.1 hypothetical protein [Acuticoccus mangrovi]